MFSVIRFFVETALLQSWGDSHQLSIYWGKRNQATLDSNCSIIFDTNCCVEQRTSSYQTVCARNTSPFWWTLWTFLNTAVTCNWFIEGNYDLCKLSLKRAWTLVSSEAYKKNKVECRRLVRFSFFDQQILFRLRQRRGLTLVGFWYQFCLHSGIAHRRCCFGWYCGLKVELQAVLHIAGWDWFRWIYTVRNEIRNNIRG
jgi:hypothetical protein